MAGVAKRERAGQGARNARNEVTEDDDVESEGTGRGLADRDRAVQLFVRQTPRETTRSSRMTGTDANPLNDSAVARNNSKYRTTAFTSRSS